MTESRDVQDEIECNEVKTSAHTVASRYRMCVTIGSLCLPFPLYCLKGTYLPNHATHQAGLVAPGEEELTLHGVRVISRAGQEVGPMENWNELTAQVRGNLIPYYPTLRRVPTRYRRMLPLPLMKRYQCLVVGSAPGVLTVAIMDRHNTAVLDALSEFTGRAIFPVLIEAARMRLLLQRLEQCYRCQSNFPVRLEGSCWKTSSSRCALRRLQLPSIILSLLRSETGFPP